MRSSNTNSLHLLFLLSLTILPAHLNIYFNWHWIFHQLYNYYIYIYIFNLRLFLIYSNKLPFKVSFQQIIVHCHLFLSSFQWTLPSLLIFHYFPYSLPANLAFVFILNQWKRLSKLQILRLLTNIIPHFTCLLKKSLDWASETLYSLVF